MKKIALITAFFPPQVGGIELYLQKFVQAYPGELVLITPKKPSGQLPKNVQVYTIPFFSARPMFPAWLPFVWKLKKILRNEGVEHIVLGHFAPYAPGIALVAMLLHIPWSTFLHGVDFFQWSRYPFKSFLRKKILRRAEYCIANGSFLAGAAQRAGVEREHIHIISPGIDSEEYYPERPKRFYTENDLLNKHIVLSIGRLIPRKGFDTTIRAFAAVHRDIPNAELILLGEGPEHQHLEQLAEQMGVAQHVRFLGNVTDVAEKRHWYSAADCFVMPTRMIGKSDTESFGIVYVEALACGTPVIASELGGVREIVRNNKTGYLVGDGTNVEVIADRLRALLQTDEPREQFRRAARDSVVPHFTWGHQFRELMLLWENE